MNNDKYIILKKEIDKYLGDYGEIYTPNDITYNIADLIGLEIQKKYLDSFFNALKEYSKKIQQNFFPIPIILSALLVGPPGTGKTTLTKALAKKYEIPLIVIFSNTLIASLLGESLSRIKNLLRQAEEYGRKNGTIILFFDEIDAISSERANPHEVGEIKRTVISFLQELDLILEKQLPIGIIGATNHPEQLDRAVWRRFTYKIDFPKPAREVRLQILDHFIKKIEKNNNFIINFNANDVIELTENFTGADIERAFQISLLYSLNSKKSNEGGYYLSIETFVSSLKLLQKHNINNVNNEQELINSSSNGVTLDDKMRD
ncbi:MAG: AAA family ATPase [Promethearchaeota archaeon]